MTFWCSRIFGCSILPSCCLVVVAVSVLKTTADPWTLFSFEVTQCWWHDRQCSVKGLRYMIAQVMETQNDHGCLCRYHRESTGMISWNMTWNMTFDIRPLEIWRDIRSSEIWQTSSYFTYFTSRTCRTSLELCNFQKHSKELQMSR